jgi:hypothetical protein
MARVFYHRDFWWNPSLYLSPWWFRNLGFLIFDSFGFLWLTFIPILVVFGVRKRLWFELMVFLGPLAVCLMAFNYHSASHGYYHLCWLPFFLVGGVHIAVEASSDFRHARFFTFAAIAIAVLSPLAVLERNYGAVERLTNKSDALNPFLSLQPRNTSLREVSALAALTKAATDNGPVAYFGNFGLYPFLDLNLRGWLVEGPSTSAEEGRMRIPRSVMGEFEWRKVNAEWFRARLRRGLSVVVVDVNSTWDLDKLTGWCSDAGFVPTETVADHILLMQRPQAFNDQLRRSVQSLSVAHLHTGHLRY